MYLGETLVDWKTIDTFKDFTKDDWVMYYIEQYGSIDGDHHSKWLIDQIARIVKGSSVTVKIAKWSDGQYEYRVHVDEGCEQYDAWRKSICDEDDYDEGIPP